jgi:AcrR family transcriptional regulator
MAIGRQPREEARRARTDVYRQHVLGAAEQVFAERGYEAAKLQDISRRAGLSMGTIYAIFPSKAVLHRTLLEERGRELLALAREVASRDVPPRAALDGLIDVYVGYFVSHPGFLRMRLRAGTSWALSPGGPDARVRHWQDIQALQADIFRRGVADGVFVDEDPGYLARLFSALDQVLLADWVAGGMRAERAELARRLREQVGRSFVRPVTRSPRTAPDRSRARSPRRRAAP